MNKARGSEVYNAHPFCCHNQHKVRLRKGRKSKVSITGLISHINLNIIANHAISFCITIDA